MKGVGALLESLKNRAAREDGFVLPTVIMIMAVALIAVAVATMSSVRSESSAGRDERSKTAFAAAETGVQQGLGLYNRVIAPVDTCLKPTSTSVTTVAKSADGWCPAVTGTVGGNTWSYRVKPAASATGTLEVVGYGTVSDVQRRVYMTATRESTTGATYPFSTASVIARQHIYVDADAYIKGNVAAGGVNPSTGAPIELRDRASLCGNAQIPSGKSITRGNSTKYFSSPNCSGSAGTTSYGSVNIPEVEIPTANDNTRLTNRSTNCSSTTADCYSGENPSWNATTRVLNLNAGTNLYLKGANYVFCSVNLNSNANIYVASGTRIYFDEPSKCANTTSPININAGSYIRGISSPPNFALLVKGSTSTASQITVTGNTELPPSCTSSTSTPTGFVLYAPNSTVYMNSSARICGAVAAKVVHVQSNSNTGIYSYSDASNWPIGGGTSTTKYTTPRLVECSATTSPTTPSADC